MRLLTVAFLVLTVHAAGCVGKFRDADERFSGRIQAEPGDQTVRTFEFPGDASASMVRVRPDFEFDEIVWLELANEHQGPLWNWTFNDPRERVHEESWGAERKGKDWSGTWTFTIEATGPMKYAFGFYWE